MTNNDKAFDVVAKPISSSSDWRPYSRSCCAVRGSRGHEVDVTQPFGWTNNITGHSGAASYRWRPFQIVCINLLRRLPGRRLRKASGVILASLIGVAYHTVFFGRRGMAAREARRALCALFGLTRGDVAKGNHRNRNRVSTRLAEF